ncbi:nucleotidyltransferase domain-containing protein [Candidatus Woesearchaeota archaeon]|nr:nucleotidyltransferase domain-containing protein [Candidatus Woesearchaeota archaeon]
MDIYKLNFTVLELEMFSFLSVKAGEKLSQREIAHALNVSPTAIANAVKNLAVKNLIKAERTKTINFISFNRDNPKAIELKRVENLRQIYISGFSDFLEEKLAGATIILFGSYARGEDTKASDIDIAVIGRADKLLDLNAFEKALSRQINVNFYNSWKDMHKHLRSNVLSGITLHGGVEL